MKKLKPTQQMPDKINRNADKCIKDALSLLHIHGFVTEEESSKIETRISKWEKDFYNTIVDNKFKNHISTGAIK